MTHPCHPSMERVRVGAGRSGILGHLWLSTKLDISLGYATPYLTICTQWGLARWLRFLLLFLIWFIETGFLCVTALGVLELDQAGLELTEICPSLPPKCWN